MNVEWDERKRDANLEKHGVDFTRAARIFAHPVLERLDDRHDYGEERWIAIGRSQLDYFVVVYTWRGDARRLITAWRAGGDERQAYDDRIRG